MRTLLTLLAILIGLSVAMAVFMATPAARQESAPATPTTPARDTAMESADATTTAPSTAPTAAPTPQPQAEATTISTAPLNLTPRPAEVALTSTVGSTDADGDLRMKVQFTAWGAGIMSIDLARYRQEVLTDEPYRILNYFEPYGEGRGAYFPFAAQAVTVNGQRIGLQDLRWRLDPDQPGRYELDLVDDKDQPVLRLVRHYHMGQSDAGYDLTCEQKIINLSDKPMSVVWQQYGLSDAPAGGASYIGDQRTFAQGYFTPSYDPKRRIIDSRHTWLHRPQVIKELGKMAGFQGHAAPPPYLPLWPRPDVDQDAELVWIATVNRYFALALHLPVTQGDDGSTRARQLFKPDGPIADARLVLLGFPTADRYDKDPSALLVQVTSKPVVVPAHGQTDLTLAMYAGPRQDDVLRQQPFATLRFENLIRYELGCTWCTFQFLAKGLLWFLEVIHAVTFDWGISIIMLVLVVRLILHPITKRAQINMTKMGKQMQELQPEMEKLKKKYANDQQAFQQEQMKLWREKGVNPFNMLGCLPMFLQTPIWIALYAMLYFAIELRHQPAFYGMFQLISGDRWLFLADLSSPDNFIKFAGEGISIPLIFINAHLNGINVIPILMGVVFYYQQKLTMPPATTEQAKQQQQMMKFMTILFPFFLYSAPSGLTLYILASTAGGIIDSYYVRKHIRQQEANGELLRPKPRKPGGFMDRMSKLLESKMAEIQAMQNGGASGPSQRGNQRRDRK